MSETTTEHRRHPRFTVGLPVKLTLAGRATPLTVELMDLSKAGGRFRASGDDIRIGDSARFGFVLPGQRHCMAAGRCVRVRATGEFALNLERANDAFRGFMDSLSGSGLARSG